MKRIVFLLSVVVAFAMPVSAVAGQCGYDYCWGAVGVGSGGAWGYSYGQFSEADAVNELQRECGGDCDTVRTFYNTCGAMAQGSSGNWGFGWADSQSQAEANAMGYCYENGGGCSIRVWACSY